jgi:hypothetical protein
MRIRYWLIGVAMAGVCGPAMAGANILPGSGDTVMGSSIHDGFDPSVAGGNLINGTSNAAFSNGDPRWVFADGTGADENLIVDLGSDKSVDVVGFDYSGVDRIPTSFSVLTSTNGINFNLIAGPTAVPFGTPVTFTTEFVLPPSLARYVEYDFGSNSIGTGCPGCGGGDGQGAGIISLDIQAVPEPATWAMMLLGVGMLGGGLRQARRRNESGLASA